MNVVIIEDESSVAQNISDLLLEINPKITILVVLETIRDSILWFEQNEAPDIAFFDIKIADGYSFEILERAELCFPIIFTTAFDEYALKAFKYNSIDYLLKPINKDDLEKALFKYQNLYTHDKAILNNNAKLIEIIKEIKTTSKNKIYKSSFLVNYRHQLIPLKVQNIAYFYLESQIVYCKTYSKNTYQITGSLEKIANQLNPSLFFRVNRQYIVSRNAIKSASVYQVRKLKVILFPRHSEEIIVSKLKAARFKSWLH